MLGVHQTLVAQPWHHHGDRPLARVTAPVLSQAVSLIKRAVELDGAGRLQEAFEAYRDSLRFLVPVVHSETDAVRRGALTAKLTRCLVFT